MNYNSDAGVRSSKEYLPHFPCDQKWGTPYTWRLRWKRRTIVQAGFAVRFFLFCTYWSTNVVVISGSWWSIRLEKIQVIFWICCPSYVFLSSYLVLIWSQREMCIMLFGKRIEKQVQLWNLELYTSSVPTCLPLYSQRETFFSTLGLE